MSARDNSAINPSMSIQTENAPAISTSIPALDGKQDLISMATDARGPLLNHESRNLDSHPSPQSASLFNKSGITHTASAATEAASGRRADGTAAAGHSSLLALSTSGRTMDTPVAHIAAGVPPLPVDSPYYPGYTHIKPNPQQHSSIPSQHPHHQQPPAPYPYLGSRLPPPGMRPPVGYYPYYPYASDLQRIPPVDQGDASHPKLPRILVDPKADTPDQRPYPEYQQRNAHGDPINPPHVGAPNTTRGPGDELTSSTFEDRPPPKKRGRKRIEVAEVLANNDLSHCSPLGEKELEADHRKHKRPSRPQAPETTTGERQYPCTFPGCEWSFVRISDQRRHLRSHQEPLFVCPFYAEDNSCHRNGGSFTRSDVLKRHLRLVHFVQFKQSESGWCRYCEKIFPSHKFFLDHCDTCAINNKRKTRKGAPESEPESHQHQSEDKIEEEPEADLELLSTASSMLAKEPGELPLLGSLMHGREHEHAEDRHGKRKGRSSKSSLSGTIQAGHHM